MTGLELFLLGRHLMKIGEQAIPKAVFHQLPASVRSVAIDVIEHPGSSVAEITARTGFPQSHVSASVARLRRLDVLVTTVDPNDRRRTLVRAHPDVPRRAARLASVPIDDAVAAALDIQDGKVIREVVTALEALARRFADQAIPGAGREGSRAASVGSQNGVLRE